MSSLGDRNERIGLESGGKSKLKAKWGKGRGRVEVSGIPVLTKPYRPKAGKHLVPNRPNVRVIQCL